MSTSSDKQDPVVEARELFSKATPGPWFDFDEGEWLHEPKSLLSHYEDAMVIARAPDLLSSLCNELEEARRCSATQADSIKALHEQEKVMRAAIEGLISTADFALSTPGFVRGREQLKNAIESAHAAITPKVEEK